MSDESKKAQDSNNDEIENSEESGSIENSIKPKLAGSVDIKSHDLSEINKLASLDLPPPNKYELQTAGEAFQKANEETKAYEGINIGEAFQQANEATKAYESINFGEAFQQDNEATKAYESINFGEAFQKANEATKAYESINIGEAFQKANEVSNSFKELGIGERYLKAQRDKTYEEIDPIRINESFNGSSKSFVNSLNGYHDTSYINNLNSKLRQFEKEKLELEEEKERLIKEKEILDSEVVHFEAVAKMQDESIKTFNIEKNQLEKENLKLSEESLNSSKQIKDLTLEKGRLFIEKQDLIEEKQDLIEEKQNLIKDKSELQIEIDKLESLKSDLNRRSEIANSAKAFMDDEIKIRRLRRDSYQNIAHAWSIGAAFLIILGLGLFYDQYDLLNVNYILKEGVSIPVLTSTYLLLKAGFFISAFGIAIRFCMVFRDKLMLEASKENEKIDSMSYGKFYIDTYAETSTREQVTEALSGWNKSNLTTPKDNTEEAEPPLNQDLLAPQNLKSISDFIQGLIKSNNKESKPEAKQKEKAE